MKLAFVLVLLIIGLLIFVSIFVRLNMFIKIRRINGYTFDKKVGSEIVSLLFYINLPYKLENDYENINEAQKFIKTANLFTKITWFAWLSILVLIVLMNVLNHVFGMEL